MSTELGNSHIWRALSARTIFLHQAVAESLGLNLTDHKCLDILSLKGSMTAGDLARASNLTSGAITGVVDRLEMAGYVRRTADQTDRRKTVIVVVPDKLIRIQGLFESLSTRTAALMASYTDEQQTAINDFAAKTGELVEEFIGALKTGT